MASSSSKAGRKQKADSNAKKKEKLYSTVAERKDAKKTDSESTKPAKKTKVLKIRKETTETDAASSKPKKPATRAITSTRLPASDRQKLTEQNRAIFIAIPEGTKLSKHDKIAEIRSFVAQGKAKDELEKVMTPGNSYIVLVYDNTKARDLALKYLKKEKFRLDNTPTELHVEPFGADNSDQGIKTTWFVNLGFDDNSMDLYEAILKRLLSKGMPPTQIPAFEIRQVLSVGLPTERYVVAWMNKAPAWAGKQLLINDVTRHVSQEGRRACKLCLEKGHTSADCKSADARDTLSQPRQLWEPDNEGKVQALQELLIRHNWQRVPGVDGMEQWRHPDAPKDTEQMDIDSSVIANSQEEDNMEEEKEETRTTMPSETTVEKKKKRKSIGGKSDVGTPVGKNPKTPDTSDKPRKRLKSGA